MASDRQRDRDPTPRRTPALGLALAALGAPAFWLLYTDGSYVAAVGALLVAGIGCLLLGFTAGSGSHGGPLDGVSGDAVSLRSLGVGAYGLSVVALWALRDADSVVGATVPLALVAVAGLCLGYETAVDRTATDAADGPHVDAVE
jgi:hypothetical protein